MKKNPLFPICCFDNVILNKLLVSTYTCMYGNKKTSLYMYMYMRELHQTYETCSNVL